MSVSRTVGRAYGFMKTSSSSPRIKQAFENMKADPEVKVPQDLRLTVALCQTKPIDSSIHALELSGIFVTKDFEEIGQLAQISVEMGKEGANCLITARLPEATHKKTADELGHVFNLLYSCTEIMVVDEREMPVATDVYFKNGNGVYVSKRLNP